MQKLPVVFFKDQDGTVPILDWMDGEVSKRNPKIAIKCRARIGILSELGTKLPVSVAKPLRDGIWELRFEYQGVNYRILYFFSQTRVIVVSHGLWKDDLVPPREIDLAIKRKVLFESDPEMYSHAEKEDN
jgi:putative component of toxin-antitoxin plasmid stabilization module